VKRSIRLAGGAILLALLAAYPAAPGEASIIKGSIIYDNNAFADDANLIASGVYTLHGAATVKDAIAGPDLSTFLDTDDANTIADVGFLDNTVFNNPGADLAVYIAMWPHTVKVAAYRSGHTSPTAYVPYTPVSAGIIDGLPMYVAEVDLSDLGVTAGEHVSWIAVWLTDNLGGDFAGVGAIHSLPEPATLSLLALGGLSLLRRRRACPRGSIRRMAARLVATRVPGSAWPGNAR